MNAGVRTVLRTALSGRGRVWAGVVLWSTAEAVPAMLSGLLVARALDRGFLAGRPGTGLACLAGFAALIGLGAWATRQTYLRLAALVEPLRDELVRLTVDGSLRRAVVRGARPDPTVAARVSQHTEIAREAYASVLMVTQGFVVALIGAALGLLSLSAVFLVIVLPPVVLGLALFASALPRLARCQREAIIAEEQIAASTTAAAEGLADVVACGGEDTMLRAVDQHIEAHASATRKLARLTAVRTSSVALGAWLPLVLILLTGPWLLRNGGTPGMLVGAVFYVSQVLHPALEELVRGLGGPGLWLLVTLRRIVEETEVPDVPTNGAAPVPTDRVDVRLDQVTFAYGAADAPVVRRLDLMVRDGDHLAIVGPSGIGKSTLAGLLTGMLEPQIGSATTHGTPLSSLAPHTLAQLRVLVPQSGYVFSGTLRENLSYLRPDVSSRELVDVCARLGLEEVADRLGLDGNLRPAALSAGQRQLVALARAYLSPAPLVVLDEATCHLDATTEARVEAAFAGRPGALVVIAHRISSAQRARQILVLDGETALLGDHRSLLTTSGMYRDLAGHWERGRASMSTVVV
jgi:ABC-type multidrug transport system fused ATPase/permease subunit